MKAGITNNLAGNRTLSRNEGSVGCAQRMIAGLVLLGLAVQGI